MSRYRVIYSNELRHYGVKGMRWGVIRDRHHAKKDAKEYARAKMYYGEGAGNRRKLIKAKVEQRKKLSNDYSKAFDEYLARQDMSKHADAAKRERIVNTGAKKAVQTGRGVVNMILGNGARVTAAAAVAYYALHYTGMDREIMRYLGMRFG